MPVHPVCDLFPMMDTESLAGLAADIKANGLINAIVLHEGEIVDGRNRLLACRSADVEPRFVQWRDTYTGEMPIDCWIWSLNVERRHLTTDQIAWAVVQRRAWKQKQESLQAQIAAGREGGKEGGRGHKKTLPVEPPEGFPKRSTAGEIREVLAREAGVSGNKIRQALEVQKLAKDQKVGPEVSEKLRQGTVKLHEVLKQANPSPARPPAAAVAKASANAPANRHDPVAKRRMVAALSEIRGHCRGLSELDASAICRVCSAEEAATWAEMARKAASALRLFSRKLAACTKENGN